MPSMFDKETRARRLVWSGRMWGLRVGVGGHQDGVCSAGDERGDAAQVGCANEHEEGTRWVAV